MTKVCTGIYGWEGRENLTILTLNVETRHVLLNRHDMITHFIASYSNRNPLNSLLTKQ